MCEVIWKGFWKVKENINHIFFFIFFLTETFLISFQPPKQYITCPACPLEIMISSYDGCRGRSSARNCGIYSMCWPAGSRDSHVGCLQCPGYMQYLRHRTPAKWGQNRQHLFALNIKENRRDIYSIKIGFNSSIMSILCDDKWLVVNDCSHCCVAYGRDIIQKTMVCIYVSMSQSQINHVRWLIDPWEIWMKF